MAFSGGVYTLPTPALVPGQTVSSSENNTVRNDMAASFNLTWLRNGTAAATANIPMGSYKLTGLGAATTSGDALSYGQAAVVSDITATGTVTINSGTANGVAYLNGSKVLTTGSALTFNGSSMVLNTSTSSDALRITQTGTGNALLVEDSANPDSTPFVIDSNGRAIAGSVNVPVSLGTATNIESFSETVAGYTAVRFSEDSSGSVVQLGKARGTLASPSIVNSGDGLSYIRFVGYDGVDAATTAVQIAAYVDGTPGTNVMPGRLVFSTTADGASSPTERYRISQNGESRWSVSGSEQMRLTSTGLGIGTSSPATGVHLQRASGNTYFRAQNNLANVDFGVDGAGTGVLWNNSNYSLAFGTNNTERMRIDTSGNVGIGTSSPTNYGAGYTSLQINNNTTGGVLEVSNSTTVRANFFASSAGTSEIGTITSHPMVFKTVNAERMRIDSSGNLLIGRTSGSGVKLNVSAPASNHPALFATQTSGWASLVAVNTGGSGTRNFIDFRLTEGGANVGSITTDGSTTSYNTSSDYRLKENIQPMQNALEFVRKQRPVTYNWKADGSKGSGYIAHWMQEDGAGNCVTGKKDAVDKDGKPVYQGIDTSFMVAPLNAAIIELADLVDTQTKLIQELKAELDATKAEVAALKGN